MDGAAAEIRSAFYFTCSLRRLNYVDTWAESLTLSEMVQTIRFVAEENELALLIILGQLRASDDFPQLLKEIGSGLRNPKKNHRVIVSSSPSRTSNSVFGEYVDRHVRFQDFTTREEAEALAVPGVDIEDLTNVSFLEAIRSCSVETAALL